MKYVNTFRREISGKIVVTITVESDHPLSPEECAAYERRGRHEIEAKESACEAIEREAVERHQRMMMDYHKTIHEAVEMSPGDRHPYPADMVRSLVSMFTRSVLREIVDRAFEIESQLAEGQAAPMIDPAKECEARAVDVANGLHDGRVSV